jgi:hypothetical protein
MGHIWAGVIQAFQSRAMTEHGTIDVDNAAVVSVDSALALYVARLISHTRSLCWMMEGILAK